MAIKPNQYAQRTEEYIRQNPPQLNRVATGRSPVPYGPRFYAEEFLKVPPSSAVGGY